MPNVAALTLRGHGGGRGSTGVFTPAKMSTDRSLKHRIVKPPRRVYGVEAKQRIARELHGIVCSVRTSEQHRDWHYDLRRKRLQAWGQMLRLLDVLIESGAPAETVLTVPDLLREYATDQLETRDNRQPPRAA